MSQEENRQERQIPSRDEHPQQDNSDKTADGQANPPARDIGAGREKQEMKDAEEPSGYRGENPSTAGSGNTEVSSGTPENAAGRLNPSAPADTGTTVAHTEE